MKRLLLIASLAMRAPIAAAQEEGYWEEGQAAGEAVDGYEEAQGEAVNVDVDLAAPGNSASFESFREGLSPYGEWVTVAHYGRVWRPARVATGWRPYFYGRWEWTDEGWLWVSDEPWGWATYHYGRWTYDPYAGWVWVPGYQWAPAWVSWRYGTDCIGWAPLAPGFSIYVSNYPAQLGWWSFVPSDRFVGVPVYSVAFAGARVPGLFRVTRPAPPRAAVFGVHAPAWGGPARPFIEHRIGRPVAPVRLQAVGSPRAVTGPMPAGFIPVYRPEVSTRLPRSRLRGAMPMPPGERRPANWRTEGAPGRGELRNGPAFRGNRPFAPMERAERSRE